MSRLQSRTRRSLRTTMHTRASWPLTFIKHEPSYVPLASRSALLMYLGPSPDPYICYAQPSTDVHHWHTWFNAISLPALKQELPILKPIDIFTHTTKLKDHTPVDKNAKISPTTNALNWKNGTQLYNPKLQLFTQTNTELK